MPGGIDIRSFFGSKQSDANATRKTQVKAKASISSMASKEDSILAPALQKKQRREVSAADFFNSPTTGKNAQDTGSNLTLSTTEKQKRKMENVDDEEKPMKKHQIESPRIGKHTLAVKEDISLVIDDGEEEKKIEIATASTSKRSKLSSSSSSAASKRNPSVSSMLEQDTFDTNNATSQCLMGYTFCFSGVLPEIHRKDAEELIKVLGGRVTNSVSSRTDYLVVGLELEDGRDVRQGSKYKRAVTGGNCQMVQGVKKFYGLLQQFSDNVNKNDSSVDKIGTHSLVSVGTDSENNTKVDLQSSKILGASASVSEILPNPYLVKNPYGVKANPYTRVNVASGSSHNTKFDANHSKPGMSYGKNETKNMLWVDKYKPAQSRDILGNADAVRKLQNWLQTWEQRFNRNEVIGKSFSSPQGPWKAALLSGPPGIGKTTTALLVAQEAGRDVLEFNASDVRSQKAMKEIMGDITGSQTLQFRQNSIASTHERRKTRCIIMDEVDGMGGGDRSGIAELIRLIKNSRVPIVCICNDRQSQKIKSLLPYCLDLRYRRPIKSVIASRAVEVARLEGMSVELNAAEAMVESCGNDVRQVLNCLQMWASKNECASLTYKNMKRREHSTNKDEILRVSLFDAAKTILEGRRGLLASDQESQLISFSRRNEAFFVDYNFIGLLVQQNYLKVMQGQFNEKKRRNDSSEIEHVLDRMRLAAECVSDYGLAERSLRDGQNWSLLPTTAMLAVKTGFHAGGENGAMFPGFPEFTTLLGRYSSHGKKIRLLSELAHHMNFRVSGGTSEIRLSYLPVLRDRFLSLFINEKSNSESISDAISLMDEYGLDRGDVFEKLDEFHIESNSTGAAFTKIDSKMKAAFTRAYNQGIHSSQALVAEQGGAKIGKSKSLPDAIESKDPDAIDDDAVNDSDEEKEDTNEIDEATIKSVFGKKKTSRKNKPTGSTKAKTKPKGRAK